MMSKVCEWTTWIKIDLTYCYKCCNVWNKKCSSTQKWKTYFPDHLSPKTKKPAERDTEHRNHGNGGGVTATTTTTATNTAPVSHPTTDSTSSAHPPHKHKPSLSLLATLPPSSHKSHSAKEAGVPPAIQPLIPSCSTTVVTPSLRPPHSADPPVSSQHVLSKEFAQEFHQSVLATTRQQQQQQQDSKSGKEHYTRSQIGSWSDAISGVNDICAELAAQAQVWFK